LAKIKDIPGRIVPKGWEKRPAHVWYMAAATVAGSLLLWNKLKKLISRFFAVYLRKTDNRDAIARIMSDALIDISIVLGPEIRPLVNELQRAHSSGSFDNMSDAQIEKFIESLINKKFRESSRVIDQELSKIVPKIREHILSDLRDEFIVFLFSEGIIR